MYPVPLDGLRTPVLKHRLIFRLLQMESLPIVKVPWGHTAGQLLVAHAKITQQEPSDLAIKLRSR